MGDDEAMTMRSRSEVDFVLRTIETRDVHFVRLWFADVLGNLKSISLVSSELEAAFNEGMGFDGSCIEGFSPTHESDRLAFPDPSTFQVLPWRPSSNAVARMFCDLRNPDGTPFEADPRYVLRRVVKKAQERGFMTAVGPELEFFYFESPESPKPLDRGGYFDLTSLDSASDLRRDTVLTLENMGIPVEYSFHEKGPSQHEIDLRFDDALAMADAVMTYKLVVKEIALKHGVFASFMPKPLAEHPGNGMHIHLSLFDLDGHNVFFDPHDAHGIHLSRTGRSFIAGLLRYAPEFCLVTNQYVNSYKRMGEGGETPSALAWSRTARSAIVRVPQYRPSNETSCRVELRNADPSANPYLAFAVILAAGIAGIDEDLELEGPLEELSQPPRHLPRTLGDAVAAFESSELMRATLGEPIHRYLTAAKRAQWEEYCSIVTEWEMDQWLAVL